MKVLEIFSRYQRPLGLFLVAGLIAIEYFGFEVTPAVEFAIAYFAGALGIARPSEMAARGVEALRVKEQARPSKPPIKRKTANKAQRRASK